MCWRRWIKLLEDYDCVSNYISRFDDVEHTQCGILAS